MLGMALDISKLAEKIDALGVESARRQIELQRRWPDVQAKWQEASANQITLREQAEKTAKRFRWAGAIPTHEPIASHIPAPARVAHLTVIGADGSQIYPNRHSLTLYYILNFGALIFRYGVENKVPGEKTYGQLYYEEKDLLDDEGGLITAEMVNAQRSIGELALLAELAATEAQTTPTVTLLDNGLLLYLAWREQKPKFAERVTENYLRQLDELRNTTAALAGITDRPRSANLLRLLHLFGLPTEPKTDADLRLGRDWRGLTDAVFFADLPPGHRSALFMFAGPDNLHQYQPRGHGIYFFFLNASHTPHQPHLLRVEVPEWVALNPSLLELAHAAIYAQCQMLNGFPYVLARADQLAVVSETERKAIEERVARALIQNGLPVAFSLKQQQKTLTRSVKGKYR